MNSKNVILISTADWGAPYLTNKQHTAKLLAKRGFRVLYVESMGLRLPTANMKDIKRIWERLKNGLGPIREVEKNIWLLSPLGIPFKQHNTFINWFNQSLLRLRLRGFCWLRNFNKAIVWTYHPYIFNAIRKSEVEALIYHCVDDLSAIPGIDSVNFLAKEKILIQKSDHIFVTNRQLLRKCEHENSNVHYMSNVVDLEHFINAHYVNADHDAVSKISKPRLCYVGALSDYKIDFELVYVIANKRQDWSWVFIGEEREGQKSHWFSKLRKLNNVICLGKIKYEELPKFLGCMDVGLLPTLVNDYTKSMFPMKYYEYLAAGLPVVSTPIEFAKELGIELLVGGNYIEFELAIEKQLLKGRYSLDQSCYLVGENTWDARLDKMLELINKKTCNND
jgi:glycosyltransferase involved in cell wall biosynthesis